MIAATQLTVSATPLVQARDVHAQLGGRPVVRGVDLDVARGELVAVVGPNGAGKSSLLGALAGDLPFDKGTVTLDGRPIRRWRTTELARIRAVLPQQTSVSFPFRVTEVVRMGRSPWVGTVAEAEDDEALAVAAREADIVHLLDRPVTALSGGERARVALARVLAQDTPVVLLDEPTAALDLGHQEHVLGVVRRRASAGRAVVVVLHDLDLAAAYADRVVVMSGGAAVADGPPDRVLTSSLLSDVYRHPIAVMDTESGVLIRPRRIHLTSST